MSAKRPIDSTIKNTDMCGIWATFGKNSTSDSCRKALKTLEPRGPEGSSYVEISGIGVLGFTRLAINGLTNAGMQPMKIGNITWAVNGEIYNWKELNSQYELGCTSGSDCEVVGAMYKRFRNTSLADMFRLFDGVFACIIIDEELEQIVIARDPYGVRPLYKGFKRYAYDDKEGLLEQLYFGSEFKTVIADTPNVSAFEPGRFEVYNMKTLDSLESVKYHSLSLMKIPVFSEIDMASYAVRTAVEMAVKKRMMTERPCAALLSGGVDSSLIASLVSKELRLRGAPPLKTFSIGMAGSSDLTHARIVADWIGSDHTEIVMTADEFFSAIPDVIRDIESYDTTTVRASVGNWLIAREVARRTECKVLFNGDGADEVFGSYLYLNNAPDERAYEKEVVNLLENIHTFDVLRSDRSISSHGLEPRTPFLDKGFIQTVASIPLKYRRPVRGVLPEKWLLRRAFDDGITLPREVLWRRKEAFSDGVSGEKSWYEITQEKAAGLIPPGWEKIKFVENVPRTPEMFYYRSIFKDLYGASIATVPFFWMPKWSNTTDPSARTLSLY
jgi:asparagine synthase (glutamine-hydrolysing)